MKEIILSHWRDIVTIALFIVSVVIALIRKKPVLNAFDNILVYIDNLLPGLIKSAETFNGSELKMDLVLKAVVKAVKDKYGVSLDSSTINLVRSKVEGYLSTPQRKES